MKLRPQRFKAFARNGRKALFFSTSGFVVQNQLLNGALQSREEGRGSGNISLREKVFLFLKNAVRLITDKEQ